MTSCQSHITDKAHFSPTIEVIKESCLRRRLNSYNCTLCVDNCQTQAISISKQGVCLDHKKCSGCGRCTAVCPSETFTFSGFDLYETLQAMRASDNAVISCFRHASNYPAVSFLPCLATLSTEALLFLSLTRNGTTYLNAINCTNCINSKYLDLLTKTIQKVEQTLEGDHTLNIVIVTNKEQLPTSLGEGRRSYLKSLANDIVSYAKKKHLYLFDLKKQQPNTSRIVPKKTMLLQQTLQSTQSPLSEALRELCTPELFIEDNCTSCPRCIAMCPTGALTMLKTKNSKELTFNPAKCNACNLCSTFCKEGSLKITPAPLLD